MNDAMCSCGSSLCCSSGPAGVGGAGIDVLRVARATRAEPLRPAKAADAVESRARRAGEWPTDQVELSSAAREYSAEEAEQIEKLQQRDREVRQHEAAHLAAAGAHARGGATFEYLVGPDGKRYAIGGEVNVDTSPVAGDPEATIRKMEQIQAAALAPAEPSGQDRAVAAQAAAQISRAKQEQSRMPSDRNDSPSASGRRPAKPLDVVA
jgi:hypothetical protein